jgi:T5SS/PEP-CTERM-associated repeat protein
MKNKRFRTTALRMSLLFTALGGGASESRAADRIWDEANGGTFSAPVHWFNGVPGRDDIAHFGMTVSNSIFLQVRYQVDFFADATNQAIKVEDDGVTFDLNGQIYTTTLLDANEIGNVASRRGFLVITDGILVVAPFANLSIGAIANSTGSLIVSTGGLILGPPSLLVGRFGTGFLTVNNGGDIIADNVHIGNDAGAIGTAAITGAGSALVTDVLTVGNAGSGTLNVTLGGQVENNDGFVGNGVNSAGTATVDGSKWDNSRDLFVGRAGMGTLNIINAGRVESRIGTLGHLDGGEGAVIVDGPGSIWISSGDLRIGNLGLGTLEIKNAAEVRNAAGVIGQGETGSFDFSTVSVDGPGSQWINSGNLTVGDVGFGKLLITNGGLVENVDAQIGRVSCCNSRVVVDGANSRWISSGAVTVGEQGAGSLQIFRGGVVQSATGRVGVANSANSVVSVNGPGSQWTNDAGLTVGDAGRGLLSISGGGKVQTTGGPAFIGADIGGNGEVTVNGPGSQLINSQTLFVGSNGQGTLDITDGARVQSSGGQVGFLSDGVGGVTVFGPKSEWTSSGLTVGSAGQGTLEITDGGRVLTFQGRIGSDGSGDGVVRVSGAESLLTVSGLLFVGGIDLSPGGTATLDIEEGGTVFVALDTVLYSGGRVRLLGGTLDTEAIRRFQGGGEFVWAGGTLHVGTFEGDLVNGGLFPDGGTLAPGHSAGLTTIQGNYTQRSRGTMEIEVGGTDQGTEFDFVGVTGHAELDGSLKLELIHGFVPNPAQTFVVLSANSLSGAFVSAPNGERVTTPNGRGSFIVHYGPGSAFEPAQVVLTDFRPTTAGDCNVSGTVDLVDHATFISCLTGPAGEVVEACECFDVNADGSVDLADFAQIQGISFGE